VVSTFSLHKRHIPNTLNPLCCKISQERILFSASNHVNNLIFRGTFHFHIAMRQPPKLLFHFIVAATKYTFLIVIKPVELSPNHLSMSGFACKKNPLRISARRKRLHSSYSFLVNSRSVLENQFSVILPTCASFCA
jgi:hypothetical protein